MNPRPKHYLADVPQELRLRVLDLCVHRLWHDALDLLHQNGFTQYEWYELVWFHDNAPADLPDQPNPDAQGDGPLTLTTEAEPTTLTVSRGGPTQPNLNASVKVRRPRSKVHHLPTDIQDNLNGLLAKGRTYPEIIQWLNDQGYPGFNKVNLHNWRITGFQTWLWHQKDRNLAAC